MLVGGLQSTNSQDVFLCVKITLLVPSFKKCHVRLLQPPSIKEKRDICVIAAACGVCVCVVSLVNNSFTSVVVPVECSCTGRRPSQVITALTGRSRHSLAISCRCVCVFSFALVGKTWQEKQSQRQRRDVGGKGPESRCCTIPQNNLRLTLRESHKRKCTYAWAQSATVQSPYVSIQEFLESRA